MISFEELLVKVRGEALIPRKLLCLDPGNTTGWSMFMDGKFTAGGQLDTVDKETVDWNLIKGFIEMNEPDYVVCEDYKIYAHKLERHSFSPVMTLRLIGGIDCICSTLDIPIHYQMAATAKGFVTDEKLKAWNYWQKGERHARDSIRHGCYFLLFKDKGKNIT